LTSREFPILFNPPGMQPETTSFIKRHHITPMWTPGFVVTRKRNLDPASRKQV